MANRVWEEKYISVAQALHCLIIVDSEEYILVAVIASTIRSSTIDQNIFRFSSFILVALKNSQPGISDTADRRS